MRSRLLVLGLLAGAPLLAGCVVASSSSSSGGGGFLFLLLPLFFVFMVARMFRSSARRSFGSRRGWMGSSGWAQTYEEPQRFESRQPSGPPPSEQMIRAELDVLAHDVVRLEPQVALNDAARADFEVASHRYRVAQAAMSQPHDEAILPRIQPMVDEARDAMARVRAILDGRSSPAR